MVECQKRDFYCNHQILETIHIFQSLFNIPAILMNVVIVRKHVATPLNVVGDLRIGVDEVRDDVLRVLERRDGDQVGNRHFVVSGQEIFSGKKIVLEQLMTSGVFLPVF